MVLENYQTLHSIGKGACGDVYLVKNIVSSKCYALKRVELDESRKTRTKIAVLREARIMSELKHPHIVAFQESFFDAEEKHLCIILDYCDGGSLEEKIKEANDADMLFNEKQIIQWFLQVTMAVKYLHSQKVLHRDLKTQNIFLNKSGTICKLGDFGIAKSIDSTLDVASTCVGTPCYLSPEMCQDIPYTSKADIWALGCVLYELCSLKPAFDAHNLISLFYKIVKAQYEPIPAAYSDELAGVLDALLTKEPDLRPSAREILAMPYIREELLQYIEEHEFKLQQIRLPTRQGNRPFTTPTIRNSVPIEVTPVQVQNTRQPLSSNVKRAISCRPTLLTSANFLRDVPVSARQNSRKPVSTIVEETEDQLSQSAGGKATEASPADSADNSDLYELEENDKAVEEADNIERMKSRLTESGLPHNVSISTNTKSFEDNAFGQSDNRNEKSTERESTKVENPDKSKRNDGATGMVKRLSKTPEPIRRIIQEDQVRSRSLTPDSAKKSRTLPQDTGKENIYGGSYFAVSEVHKRNLFKKEKFSMNLDLKGGDIAGTSKMKQTEFEQRKLIKEPQRTPRVIISNALQVEIDKDNTSASGQESKVVEVKYNEIKKDTNDNKKDTNDIKKDKNVINKDSHDTSPKKKDNLKIPKAKQKCNAVTGKEKINSKSKKKDKKTNNGKPSKVTTAGETQDKKLTKEGTEMYYSDDFDEDSYSDIEEDIPEEISVKRSETILYHDIGDIPEDLPDGEEAVDLDSVDDLEDEIVEELDAVVMVAKEVHENLPDDTDDLIVDSSHNRLSANLLLRKHCRKQLGEETYERMKTMCQGTADKADIRALETCLGKENIKTYYVMSALMKKPEK